MTKNIFSVIFGWIVSCYDNSLFEKIMSKIFGFCSENIPKSKICGYFKNGFSCGRIWRESLAAKIVRSPFAACRGFYHKNEEKIEAVKQKSGAYAFLGHIADVCLRDFGIVMLSLAVGIAAGTSIFAKWGSTANILITFAVLLVGLFLCLCKGSFAELSADSFMVKQISRVLTCRFGGSAFERVRLAHIRIISAAAFLLGCFVVANAPLETCLSLAAVALVIAIFYNEKIGVFLFAPLAALLPTMALAALVLLTFAAFVLKLMFGKNAEYVSTPFQPWIVLFIGLAAYSALTGAAVASSLKILMLYVSFTLGYVLIVNTIRNRTDWTVLVSLMVFAAALVALYGVYQNFFGASSAQSWVDENMFTDIKTRVYSTLDNPNVLGEYLIMLIPIAFAMLVKMKDGLQRVMYTLCNLVMFACLMYTWSRGAWLGVMIGIVFFVLLKDRRWLVVCIAGLLLMPSVLPDSILSRITSIGNVKDTSTSYRVAIWIGSARLMKYYWFCGIGLGPDAFMKIYPQYALGGADFALHSHNFYLQWIIDMGIAGIFVYFGIILTGLKQIANIDEKNTLIKNVMLAATGAIFGYLFHGIAENLWYNYRMILVFWVHFGILQSGAAIACGTKKEDIIS